MLKKLHITKVDLLHFVNIVRYFITLPRLGVDLFFWMVGRALNELVCLIARSILAQLNELLRERRYPLD